MTDLFFLKGEGLKDSLVYLCNCFFLLFVLACFLSLEDKEIHNFFFSLSPSAHARMQCVCGNKEPANLIYDLASHPSNLTRKNIQEPSRACILVFYTNDQRQLIISFIRLLFEGIYRQSIDKVGKTLIIPALTQNNKYTYSQGRSQKVF
jgi:hypothetical protein